MPEDRGYPASGRPSKSSADKKAFEPEPTEPALDLQKGKKKPGQGLTNASQKKQLDELE